MGSPFLNKDFQSPISGCFKDDWNVIYLNIILDVDIRFMQIYSKELLKKWLGAEYWKAKFTNSMDRISLSYSSSRVSIL